MIKVYLCGYDDLPAKVKRMDLPDCGAGEAFATYMLSEHDGELFDYRPDAVTLEDMIFSREFDYIPLLIEKAYKLGVERGYWGEGRIILLIPLNNAKASRRHADTINRPLANTNEKIEE